MDSQSLSSGRTRPVIGIMTGSLHTDYSRMMAESVYKAICPWAEVLLFQGFDAERYLGTSAIVDESFDKHYYAQFEYANFLALDLLIISFGTISAVQNPLSMEQFLAALPPVPVILLETEHEGENICYLSSDNKAGMRNCVLHLIDTHHCRNICYVSGPQDVCDARLRLCAFREVMAERGLPVSENQIVYGDFSDKVDALIEELIEGNPGLDALVCANDEMAESAYRALRKFGLEPGKDVAVTGFDDSSSAAFMVPPLTTVRQECTEQGRLAGEIARQYLLDGVPMHSETLPTRLQVRCSCGCQKSGDFYREQTTLDAYAVRERVNKKRLVYENLVSSLFLRNLLQEDVTVHSFFYALGQVLSSVGVLHSRIALLKEPLDIRDKGRLFLPEELRVHMIQEGQEVESFPRDKAPLARRFAHTPELHLSSKVGQPTTVFPLFYGNIHYGVFLANAEHNDVLFDYITSLQIGTGLRYLFLALAQQLSQAALEANNDILKYSASHDFLTGLYNRAGILSALQSYIETGGGRYVVVLADLDHLKQINDTFGHPAGDMAIKTAAELLRCALPKDSPLGRTGGDEFAAVFAETETYTWDTFRARLTEAVTACNSKAEFPFYVKISVGACRLDSAGLQTDLKKTIKEADTELYKAKKHRPPSVIRE